jgi:hypothetical protein
MRFFIFCWQKDSMQRVFIKKCFQFTVGSVLSRNAVHKWVKKRSKHFADDEEVETEVQKWLRQQSKDFCTAGFITLVKL